MKRLKFFKQKNEFTNSDEISAEMLTNWFDWRINIFGFSYTVWLEFVDPEEPTAKASE